ncbi:MAG: hypothetical protein MUE54_12955 [Anaerolineae bacterium]|nr:hypothetical protein [Anaerolineae bacterium]
MIVLISLTACEGEPTPFPAQIVTPTPDPAAIVQTATVTTPATPAIRYAIDPSLANVPITLIGNIQRLDSQTTLLITDLGVNFDIAIRLGDADGWTRAPIPLTIGLVMRPSFEFADVIWRAIDPPEWGMVGIMPLHDGTTPYAVLRADMANLGKPDGFVIRLGVQSLVGEEALRAQLGTYFIETQAIPITNENRIEALTASTMDIMLVSWFTDAAKAEWVNLVGDENVLPLFTAPINYLVNPNLTVTLSEQGLPQVDN